MLSNQPSWPISVTIKNIDILFHFIEYFVLGILLSMSFFPKLAKSSLPILLFIIAWAISDELHQAFIPGRDASVVDIIVDTIGGIAAIKIAHHPKFDRLFGHLYNDFKKDNS
jgi:VanZ family protein